MVKMATKNKRSAGAIVDQRVTVIVQLLLRSMMRSEIVRFGTNEWGVTEWQVDKYIK
jgi:hypothetical protein